MLQHNGETPLTAADWYTVAYLTWFASTTHMAGLTVTRAAFQQLPTLRIVRVGLMFTLMMLLVVALVPTGFFNWDAFNIEGLEPTAAVPQSPAVCYFNMTTARALLESRCMPRYTGWRSPDPPVCKVLSPGKQSLSSLQQATSFESMVVAVSTVIFGFTTRCFKLMPPLARAFDCHVREPVGKAVERRLISLCHSPSDGTQQQTSSEDLPSRLWLDLVVLPCVGLFLSIRWAFYLFTSTLFEVFWIAIVVVWGFFKVYAIRATQMQTPDARLKQSAWTFGQVMALLLFVLPVLLLTARLYSVGRDSSCVSQEIEFSSDGPQASQTKGPVHGELPTSAHTCSTAPGYPVQADAFPYPTPGNLDETTPPDPHHTIPEPTKLDSLQALIHGDITGPINRWLLICVATSCTFWLFITISAMVLANNSPAIGKNSTRPVRSMSEFWITKQKMVAVILLYYPLTFARDVVLGFHIDLLLRCHLLKPSGASSTRRHRLIELTVWVGYAVLSTWLHAFYFISRSDSFSGGNVRYPWGLGVVGFTVLYSLAPFVFYLVCLTFWFGALWLYR